MQNLNYISTKLGNESKRAIIFIHGWKGNKNSFRSLPQLMKIKNVTWYFPEAPYMIDGNPNKRTWAYEIKPNVWEVDEPKRLLKTFIKNEVLDKFDSKNIFIMGFSQGAAVCYELILSFEYSLGGIFPIAGFMRKYPEANDKISLNISPKQYNTPILIGHGKDDDIVLLEASKKAFNILKEYCKNINLHIYNGRHKIGIEYLKKVKSIILSKKDNR